MQLIEIYRSPTQAACEQRAFVLQAVGIPFEIVPQLDTFTLWVPTESAATAQNHLERYEAESRPQPAQPVLPLHTGAWITPVLYSLVLIGIAYVAGRGAFGVDWYEIGALHPSSKLNGEWWRIFTALTLHTDHAHLLGNLGFGMYFGYLAARLLGWGAALIGMVVTAAAGNALDSALMPASHVSIGASTMVFAALGLIAAYSWRKQFNSRLRWIHRWSPLIAGIMLLALIGAGGERTDVLAHLTGFACGALTGAMLGRVSASKFADARLQTIGATLAVAALLGTWWLAIP